MSRPEAISCVESDQIEFEGIVLYRRIFREREREMSFFIVDF